MNKANLTMTAPWQVDLLAAVVGDLRPDQAMDLAQATRPDWVIDLLDGEIGSLSDGQIIDVTQALVDLEVAVPPCLRQRLARI